MLPPPHFNEVTSQESLYLLGMLVFIHCIFDFAGQGTFLSTAKNWNTPIPGVPWYLAMSIHVFMHAFPVLMMTGSMVCFMLELVSHFVIDAIKIEGRISFATDQLLHISVKIVYVYLIL